jgi:hypothetical protein
MTEWELRDFYELNLKKGENVWKAIIDRYHLIDKSAPIPGAVSVAEMRKMFFEYDAAQDSDIQEYIDTLDIYPKGTVARLTGEVEKWKRNSVQLHNETLELHLVESETVKKLQAEVEQLKGELNTAEKVQSNYIEQCKSHYDEIQRLNGNKTPDAVGCGKEFNIETYKTIGRTYLICGKDQNLCPDCQAKAKRVQLPEVPEPLEYEIWHINKLCGFNEKSIDILIAQVRGLIKGYEAVKRQLEGG